MTSAINNVLLALGRLNNAAHGAIKLTEDQINADFSKIFDHLLGVEPDCNCFAHPCTCGAEVAEDQTKTEEMPELLNIIQRAKQYVADKADRKEYLENEQDVMRVRFTMMLGEAARKETAHGRLGYVWAPEEPTAAILYAMNSNCVDHAYTCEVMTATYKRVIAGIKGEGK